MTTLNETVIAVALLPDGSLVVRSCVSPAETAVWLVEVAHELMDAETPPVGGVSGAGAELAQQLP